MDGIVGYILCALVLVAVIIAIVKGFQNNEAKAAAGQCVPVADPPIGAGVLSAERLEAARQADLRLGLVPADAPVMALPPDVAAPIVLAAAAPSLTFGKVLWAVMVGNFIMGVLAWLLWQIAGPSTPRGY